MLDNGLTRRAPRRRKSLVYKDLRNLFTIGTSYSQSLDARHYPCYIYGVKGRKLNRRRHRRPRARVNKRGLMNSAPRVHRTKKGKGSFKRKKGVDIQD